EPRLASHLHLSLQAGSDMILKRMKRRHLTADAIRLADRARALRPDIAFGADLIAGFPTESDAMFEDTLQHVRDLDLAWLHIFPYSPRPGTPAARMPQVDRAIIKDRAKQLRTLGAEQSSKYLEAQIGRTIQPIMETPSRGRTDGFAEIDISAPVTVGAMPRIKVTGIQHGRLLGEAA
ncbi:MAG: radical SAM protein, partial [Alphaproteobacteria bacterium]